MRKFIIALSILIASLVPLTFASAVSYAQADVFQDVCSGAGASSTVCQEKEKTKNENADTNSIFGPTGVLTKAAQILTIAVGAAAVIMIIIGGIKFALSNGDSNKINSAKDGIIYALVGIFVAILAQSIIVFVLNKL